MSLTELTLRIVILLQRSTLETNINFCLDKSLVRVKIKIFIYKPMVKENNEEMLIKIMYYLFH
jgi:hypothetical protein